MENGDNSNKETTTVTAKEEEAAEQDTEVARSDAGGANERPVDDSSQSPEDGEQESARKKRAMSPGTLALMCDEQDTLFTAPPSPSGLPYSAGQRPYGTTLHAEQERIILSEFRDCLRKIVAVGKRRGKSRNCFSRSKNFVDCDRSGSLRFLASSIGLLVCIDYYSMLEKEAMKVTKLLLCHLSTFRPKYASAQ